MPLLRSVSLDKLISSFFYVGFLRPAPGMIQLPEFSFEGLWFAWIWAFVSFRFFDIVKLGLIGWADNLGGALGVILDDILAGIAAGFTVAIVLLLT